MKTVVFYHSHCFDGTMAAAAALEAIREGRLDCDEKEGLIPIGYNQSDWDGFFAEDPKAPYQLALAQNVEQIIFVDFCPKPVVVQDLLSVEIKVVILDHHKTARDDAKQLEGMKGLDLIFDMTKSGARLAWEYFRKGVENPSGIPNLALHVEDRDLWTWAMPRTREVIAWMSASAETNDPASYLLAIYDFSLFPEECIKAGSFLCKEMDTQIKKMASSYRYLEVQGYGGGIVVNASCYQSEVCQYLYDRHEVPFVIAYNATRGGEVALSMRSKQGAAHSVDVSQMAKMFEGGGHVNAAGGVCELERWVDFLHGSSHQDKALAKRGL
jgi:oligoribonuclease NrnB/cAMP/cGMP phosphodiesterase (DHH superfamily)